MKYTYYVTKPTDRGFWVPRCVFNRHFDIEDFEKRDVVDVENSYSIDWFFVDENGGHRFEIATVQLVGGATQFISGRHRTAVLFRHIDTVPIGFSEGEAQEFAESLGLKPIRQSELLDLPDLPTVARSGS